ncbi:hypothetical protein Taro_040648 [Colocasia esculenta]|uniref:Protein FAR1-RELATED SEQUENCE n=1 Tax=Colocasia esculenta TaxID=4460 RepID=A0A843WV55_COLES|nr:hypothetical protein [Colocasia esculenta]
MKLKDGDAKTMIAHFQDMQVKDSTFFYNLAVNDDVNGGIHPRAIITYQDKAMEAAVSELFPNTRHRFFLWHILKTVPEKIGHICIANPHFMQEVDMCIYDSMSTNEFQEKWCNLMTKYENAKENDWLKPCMYVMKRMSTSQHSESINHFFDEFVTAKTTLSGFVLKYEVEIERKFYAKRQDDLKSSDTEAYLKTSSPFEKVADALYTRAIFKKFQQELIEIAAC